MVRFCSRRLGRIGHRLGFLILCNNRCRLRGTVVDEDERKGGNSVQINFKFSSNHKKYFMLLYTVCIHYSVDRSSASIHLIYDPHVIRIWYHDIYNAIIVAERVSARRYLLLYIMKSTFFFSILEIGRLHVFSYSSRNKQTYVVLTR